MAKTGTSSVNSGSISSSSAPPGDAEEQGGDTQAAVVQLVPHRRYRSFGAPIAEFAESVIHALERSKGLDAVGQALALPSPRWCNPAP